MLRALRTQKSAGITTNSTTSRSERARGGRSSCCDINSGTTSTRRAALALAARVAALECRTFSSAGPSFLARSSLLRGSELGSLKRVATTTTTTLVFSRPPPRPRSSFARCSATAAGKGSSSSRESSSFSTRSSPPLSFEGATVGRAKKTMATTTTAAPTGTSAAAPSAPPAPLSSSSSSPWDGSGTQEDLMLRDQVILVDEDDVVLGGASKFDAHRFEEGEGEGEGGRKGGGENATTTTTKTTTKTKRNGLLHRAFSVFLFDSRDRLLLQQRAACKITFPSVWTNTCCSHQLHGQVPPEVDDAGAAATSGEAPGAAAAAVRKLWHELGVTPGAIPPEDFKLVARLHYCAPDVDNAEPWGEHELDYVLLARVPEQQTEEEEEGKEKGGCKSKPAFSLDPNPEEVDATRWVTRGELREMMRDESLKWSPWFRIIADRWLLREWWTEEEEARKDGKESSSLSSSSSSLARLLSSPGVVRAKGVKEVHRVVCGGAAGSKA